MSRAWRLPLPETAFMSYILDALKRADAERGASRSPDWAAPDLMAAPTRGHWRGAMWRWAAALALLIVLVSVAYFKWARLGEASVSDGETTQEIAAPGMPPNPVVAPSPVPEPSPSVEAISGALQPATDTSSAAPKAPAFPVMPILAKTLPQPSTPQPPSRANPGKARQTMAPPSTPPPPAPVAPAMPKAAVPAPAAESVAKPSPPRASQPDLSISGSSYSANAEHRMLIVNGKVVKEGQEVAPGLALESIGQRSAVFNQNGARFNINY